MANRTVKIDGTPLVAVKIGRLTLHYEIRLRGFVYRITRGEGWEVTRHVGEFGVPVSRGHKTLRDATRTLA